MCRYHRGDESGNGRRNSGGYGKGNGIGSGSSGYGNATAAETKAEMVLEIARGTAAVYSSKLNDIDEDSW